MLTLPPPLRLSPPRPPLPSRSGVWLRGGAPWIVGLGGAVLMHTLVGPLVGPFQAKLLMDIGIAVILTVSLNMVNGLTGQFSLGHAGLMAVGAYASAAITYYGSFRLWGTPQVHGGALGGGVALFLTACLAGGALAALVGLLIGLPTLRLRGDYLAITTLGFGEILRVAIQQSGDVLFSAEAVREASLVQLAGSLGGALGFTGIPFYTNLLWVWLCVAVTLIVAFRLKYSSVGRCFLAIREDEIAAEAMGVPTARAKIHAFVLSAFFAGLAGALFAHMVGTTLNPRELGFMKTVEIFIMVMFGGMGSISGSCLAATGLTVLPEALRAFAGYRMIVYALALIVMMIVRPKGLFGIHEIWELAWVRSVTLRLIGRRSAAPR